MSDVALAVSPAVGERLGVVVIGRNEGERLRVCLASRPLRSPCVYVDSGSTDDSLSIAAAAGAEIVSLDMAIPFTAARARNAGAARLFERHPDLDYLFFVDGDCEIVSSWPAAAIDFLDRRNDVVAVCGRRRERHPGASVFNRLCDLEWDTPVGQASSVGGDAIFRAAAWRSAGGYREDLIAGEEPELCVRLRDAGGIVWRLDQEMTLHDAAMARWSQWWNRNVRSGHAFAEGASLHGATTHRHFVAETRRALAWGIALPLAIVVLGLLTPWALLLVLIYPIQWLRIGARVARSGAPIPWRYAAFLVAGRFPEAQGVAKFWAGRLVGRRSKLIEYK